MLPEAGASSGRHTRLHAPVKLDAKAFLQQQLYGDRHKRVAAATLASQRASGGRFGAATNFATVPLEAKPKGVTKGQTWRRRQQRWRAIRRLSSWPRGSCARIADSTLRATEIVAGRARPAPLRRRCGRTPSCACDQHDDPSNTSYRIFFGSRSISGPVSCLLWPAGVVGAGANIISHRVFRANFALFSPRPQHEFTMNSRHHLRYTRGRVTGAHDRAIRTRFTHRRESSAPLKSTAIIRTTTHV